MEAYVNQAVHNGMNTSKAWDAIPIIILIGDDYQLSNDYQLPPIHKGAFETLRALKKPYYNSTKSNERPQNSLLQEVVSNSGSSLKQSCLLRVVYLVKNAYPNYY